MNPPRAHSSLLPLTVWFSLCAGGVEYVCVNVFLGERGKAGMQFDVFMHVHECACVPARAPMSTHYGESGWPSPALTSVSESGGAPHRALSQGTPSEERPHAAHITSQAAAPPYAWKFTSVLCFNSHSNLTFLSQVALQHYTANGWAHHNGDNQPHPVSMMHWILSAL